MKCKYIIIKHDGLEVPIVFSELLNHSMVARLMTHNDIDRVVSAGFCYINDAGQYVCYGSSRGLGVESREHVDDFCLNKLLGTIEC